MSFSGNSRQKNGSFDHILKSPHYLFSKSQLNHLFVDNEYFNEIWHSENFMNVQEQDEPSASWRIKDRMKTTGVALVVCLNIGVDPPDANRPAVCARQECWFDPFSLPKQKSLEMIGANLQQQYEAWQSRARYKQCLDTLSDDLRRTCVSLRNTVKTDRLLLHYNGHGVPRPTSNGEFWVFGKHHTHYMPVSVYELKSWCGDPSIYVLDCSGAGALVPYFIDPKQKLNEGQAEGNSEQSGVYEAGKSTMTKNSSKNSLCDGGGSDNDSSNCILFAACKEEETLPTNPMYPADIFTSCLTTPIPIAIRWFLLQNSHIAREVSIDIGDKIPGQVSDRKTLKGEINWIFTAITDTIAWSVLPTHMFQKLLRQDLMVAALFRNFLLAQRIMKSLNCTPISVPQFPDTSSHPLWQSWDLAVENCLLLIASTQKSGIPTNPTNSSYDNLSTPLYSNKPLQAIPPSPGLNRTASTGGNASSGSLSTSFCTENLNAFELWLDFGGEGGNISKPPIYLPILLHVLLVLNHRQKALHLLSRYLSLGPQAVNYSLRVGVFPYILKLLVNSSPETQQILMSIWTYVLGFDNKCRLDLVTPKENYVYVFVQNLKSDMPYLQRTMVAFILCEICNNYRLGQKCCVELKVHNVCANLLASASTASHPHLRKWIIFVISKLCEDFNPAKYQCIVDNAHICLYQLRYDPHPAVRIAAVIALGELFGASTVYSSSSSIAMSSGSSTSSNRSAFVEECRIRGIELEIAMNVLEGCMDGCVAVRREAVIALSKMVLLGFHKDCIKMVARAVIRSTPAPPLPFSTALLNAKPSNSPKTKKSKGYTSSESPQITDPAMQVNELVWTLDPPVLSSLKKNLVTLIEEQESGPGTKKPNTGVGTSLFSNDESLAPPHPQIKPENEAAKHMAAAYVKIWLALQELQAKDPHPSVVQTVQAVNKHVKYEIANDLHIAQHGEPINAHSTGEEFGNMSPNKKPVTQPPRNLDKWNIGEESKSSSQFSDMGPPTAPIGSGVMSSAGLVLGRLDGSESVGTSHVDGRIAMATDATLMSTAYDCNRRVFLHSDEGYNPVDDMLSVQGREKFLRDKMRNDIMALDNRICDNFKPIQDNGLSGFLAFREESNASSPSNDRQSEVGSPATRSNSSQTDASMLPASLTKFESKAKITMEYATKSTLTMFHAFHDIIAVSDGLGVGIWSLDNASQLIQIKSNCPGGNGYGDYGATSASASYSSTGTSAGAKLSSLAYTKNSRITSMGWMNESTDSILMTGCDDGTIVMYKDIGATVDEATQKNNENISLLDAISQNKFSGISRPTAFAALPNVNTMRGSGTLMSWQQQSGMLTVAGNSLSIRIWDVTREQCVREFKTGVETCATALVTTCSQSTRSLSSHGLSDFSSGIRRSSASSSVDDISSYTWTFAGFADGSIGIFDQRAQTNGGKVLSGKEHNSWIISAHMRYDIPEVITGGLGGEVKFFDIRTMRSYKNFEMHKSSLTALAVHNCAPIMATGSSAKFIKLVTFGGEQLGMIRYHDGFMGQRIGPVSCLSFHPVRLMMAAGSDDNLVSIYAIQDG